MDKYRLTTEDEKEYYCKEQIPEIAGLFKGTLVIYGGGKSMWEDREEFLKINGDNEYNTMAVNVAAMFFPKLDHVFSWHANQISGIASFRKAEFRCCKALVHSSKIKPNIDWEWSIALRASTSGLMSVTLGYLLGYRKFVLCGVPYDNSGYFYKPMVNETFGDKPRGDELDFTKKKFGNSIKSMSGRTESMFSKPTAEWLKGDGDGKTM